MSDAPKRNEVFGYPAALILRDERGEFQIRDAIKTRWDDMPTLDWSRMTDAVRARRNEVEAPKKRPVY